MAWKFFTMQQQSGCTNTGMSFYDTQTYCGIVDMKVVVVSICNKINFPKVWITSTYIYSTSTTDIHYLAYFVKQRYFELKMIS
jgi:hypothetical protein